MSNRVVKKVTKVDSQIPKMKDVDYKIDKMNNVYQIKKKSKDRKKQEATLNELADDIIEMLEDVEFGKVGSSIMADQDTYNRMTNQPSPPQYVAARGDRVRNVSDSLTNLKVDNRLYANMDENKDILDDDGDDAGANPRGLVRPDKYITDYRGDGLDYGATHSESFTGTAAIALAPAAFGADTRKRKSKKKTKLETAMNRRRLVREYSPDFAAGNYKPGDAKMTRKGGKGLQDKGLGKIGHDSKSELVANGEWPKKHKANLAMSNVDEDGVDGEPAGQHNSSVGSPEDGIQSHVGHNWPAKPKNRGGQTAMKGTRYSDGGTLGGSSMEEGWNPTRIGRMMGESINIQELFDNYARSANKVTQSGFASLCEAYGQNLQIDRNMLLSLMERNRDFVFYEDEDSDGAYWVPGDEDDADMDMGMDDEMDDMDMDDDDEDGILTPEEHSEVHAELKAFCEKYGCPEDELHELCHKYAQLPMDELDAEDFGDDMDDDDMNMDDNDMDDEEYGEGPEEECWGETENEAAMDESWGETENEAAMDESWGESHTEGSMEESWDEGWGEGTEEECYDESARPRRPTISESKRRPRRK